MRNVVIVGSGISGLLYALILSGKRSDVNITIIEKSQQPGGLLKAFDYGLNGKFDYGMHNFLETGIEDLDKIIFDLLPTNEWQILEGSKRDLAGIYYNGKLQSHTPNIDIRHCEPAVYRECLADFYIHLNKWANQGFPEIQTELSAKDHLINRFGEAIATKVIFPVIEKIHKKPAEALDYMSTVFTPLTRIALFDEPLVKEMTLSTELRKCIAYSEQKKLPLERSTGRRGYYPKMYGMYRVVDAIMEVLLARKVKFLNGTTVNEVRICENNMIEAVEISSSSGTHSISNIEKLVWTSNVPLIGKLCNFSFDGLKPDKPLKTIVVSLLLSKRLRMHDLYYFFCYDKQFHTYRLNDFNAYCDKAARNGGYPISIEFLVNDSYLANKPNIESDAIRELFEFGITEPGTEVLFSKAEVLDNGFPMPTINNIRTIKKIRNEIRDKKFGNLELLGILAEDNLFFQTDVLIDTYNKANNG